MQPLSVSDKGQWEGTLESYPRMTPDPTMEREEGPLTWAEWDWWPLARLLIVAAVFGAVGHFRYGWTISPRWCLLSVCGAGELFLFLAFLSSTLAYLFAWIPLLLLYAGVLLNDILYELSRWVSEKLLPIRSTLALSLSGLIGEILLFAGLALLVRSFFHSL